MNNKYPCILVGGYSGAIISLSLEDGENAKSIQESKYLKLPHVNRLALAPLGNLLVASDQKFTQFQFCLTNYGQSEYNHIHHKNITDIVCRFPHLNGSQEKNPEYIIYCCSEDCKWSSWKSNIECEKKVITSSPLNTIAISHSDEEKKAKVYVGNDRGDVEVYFSDKNLYEICCKSINLSNLPIRSIALAKDDQRLVVACHDGNVYIVLVGPQSNLASATNSGAQVSMASGSTSSDIFRPKLIKDTEIKRAHDDVILRVVISPDQNTFITTSADSSAKIWNFSKEAGYSDKPKFILKERSQCGWVWDASFTNDSKYVVTGGDDCIVRKWSTETGQLIFKTYLDERSRSIIKQITALTIYYGDMPDDKNKNKNGNE